MFQNTLRQILGFTLLMEINMWFWKSHLSCSVAPSSSPLCTCRLRNVAVQSRSLFFPYPISTYQIKAPCNSKTLLKLELKLPIFRTLAWTVCVAPSHEKEGKEHVVGIGKEWDRQGSLGDLSGPRTKELVMQVMEMYTDFWREPNLLSSRCHFSGNKVQNRERLLQRFLASTSHPLGFGQATRQSTKEAGEPFLNALPSNFLHFLQWQKHQLVGPSHSTKTKNPRRCRTGLRFFAISFMPSRCCSRKEPESSQANPGF